MSVSPSQSVRANAATLFDDEKTVDAEELGFPQNQQLELSALNQMETQIVKLRNDGRLIEAQKAYETLEGEEEKQRLENASSSALTLFDLEEAARIFQTPIQPFVFTREKWYKAPNYGWVNQEIALLAIKAGFKGFGQSPKEAMEHPVTRAQAGCDVFYLKKRTSYSQFESEEQPLHKQVSHWFHEKVTSLWTSQYSQFESTAQELSNFDERLKSKLPHLGYGALRIVDTFENYRQMGSFSLRDPGMRVYILYYVEASAEESQQLSQK